MAVLKCNVCGGELEVNEDLSIGVCKFCDSTIVIPKNLDKKGNLYNRAVFLRQNSEFDKAVSAYEDILKEDNSDADAHWGLVLSKYGIEYVSDPRTGQHIPTCHRTQAASILSDPDYLAALEYADIEARRVIETEAKRISEIQTRILEISREEPPYDIFICYKESDEAGNRTEDSILAQELYYELVKKSYKVFFARKTLESKLGTEYEPIIYAALNSAKVMVVLGTKAENFNAVWVRNEWSRFLKMSEGSQKTIIPAYRGMSPYELPVELSALQSQDMSKIGFMQDLLDGIERCMRGEARKKAAQKETTNSLYGVAHLERLIQNSDTYLKLNNFSAAEEVYTTVTKEYPEDFRGWWGLIVCKTRNFIDIVPNQSTLNTWFLFVRQLASQEEYSNLEKIYLEYTKKIAEFSATEDMKEVNARIASYNSQIGFVEAQIESEQNEITAEDESFKHITESNDKIISDIESRIIEAQGEKKSNIKWNCFFGTMFSLGVIILFTGGWGILWGIIIGGIAFLGYAVRFSSGYYSNSSLDIYIEGQYTKLANQRDMMTEHRQEHDKKTSEHNAKIEHLRSELAEIQEKIADCRNYLSLEKDEIVTYWYAEKCSGFGVQQYVDNYIIEQRKTAFGIQENGPEEIVAIICPACGHNMWVIRKLIERGSIVCDTCGNTVEISVSKDHTPDCAYSNNYSVHEVSCPSCHQHFMIDNHAIGLGYTTKCPFCMAWVKVGGNLT